MRNIDLSSWHSILASLIGLLLITLIGVGVRLLTMVTIQQRRERMNRQINERLRTLIAAYKTLGGSFTGDLAVDPSHLSDLQNRGESAEDMPIDLSADAVGGSDRKRRIRDAVEAALSDIILLGTEQQVRLAERAANELVAGRPVHTHELVVSLRDFIRKALDLDATPRMSQSRCRGRHAPRVPAAAAARVSPANRAAVVAAEAAEWVWAWVSAWAVRWPDIPTATNIMARRCGHLAFMAGSGYSDAMTRVRAIASYYYPDEVGTG